MDIYALTKFFMWCTIINGGLFVISTTFYSLAPDLVYRTQNKLFKIPRETFNVVFYSFIGFFKIVILVFNLVPFVTLLIIG